jgi:sodium/bile acid cotransporter 7
MTPLAALNRIVPDKFILALVSTVLLASVLPCRGVAAHVFGLLTTLAIGLLFFMHGAKLSRADIVAGAGHWRLHLMVLASTFVLFPVMGLLLRTLAPALINPGVAAGMLYLCLLPSTVQSSIAFTSMAGGNVPGAVCSASASNLIGIALTPALAALFMGASGRSGDMGAAVESILLQLLVPFVAGHLSRPLIGRFIDRHKQVLNSVDRTSILLVVYTAFSAAVIEGLWHKLGLLQLAQILVLDAVVLALALIITRWASRRLGFNRQDEITIVFCGSKKSLASGVPMAGVLFPAASVGVLIIPLMIFHQMQLMVCAVLAKRYADQGRVHSAPSPVSAALGDAS